MSPLFGLVVCGGQSTRMGRDKSLLDYHGKPQRYHLYELLQPLCQRVFISCNKDQSQGISQKYETVIDLPRYENIGPASSVLSAHEQFPEADFLVIGCDYPLLVENDIQSLIKRHKECQRTVVFSNGQSIDPMIAIYQADDLVVLKDSHVQLNSSLKRFLDISDAVVLNHPDPERIKSADTIEEYHSMLQVIRRQKNQFPQ